MTQSQALQMSCDIIFVFVVDGKREVYATNVDIRYFTICQWYTLALALYDRYRKGELVNLVIKPIQQQIF